MPESWIKTQLRSTIGEFTVKQLVEYKKMRKSVTLRMVSVELFQHNS